MAAQNENNTPSAREDSYQVSRGSALSVHLRLEREGRYDLRYEEPKLVVTAVDRETGATIAVGLSEESAYELVREVIQAMNANRLKARRPSAPEEKQLVTGSAEDVKAEFVPEGTLVQGLSDEPRTKDRVDAALAQHGIGDYADAPGKVLDTMLVADLFRDSVSESLKPLAEKYFALASGQDPDGTSSTTGTTNTDYAVAPGEFLAEWMEEQGADPAEGLEATLSALGTTEEQLRLIVGGKAPVDQALAERLERLTSVPATTWLRYEALYRADLDRLGAQ